MSPIDNIMALAHRWALATYNKALDKRFEDFDEIQKALRAAIEQALTPGGPVRWQPIDTAPRDGTNILLRFGRDGVSQGKYIPGIPYPWQFIDTNNGISWLINHAVDAPGGPSHWMPLPDAAPQQPKPQPVACPSCGSTQVECAVCAAGFTAPQPQREQEHELALQEATQIATWLWKNFYKEKAPQWEVLPDIRGVLSQIDNMVAGLKYDPPAPQPQREWVGLTDADVRELDTSEFWDDHTPADFVRLVEAKLREKNGADHIPTCGKMIDDTAGKMIAAGNRMAAMLDTSLTAPVEQWPDEAEIDAALKEWRFVADGVSGAGMDPRNQPCNPAEDGVCEALECCNHLRDATKMVDNDFTLIRYCQQNAGAPGHNQYGVPLHACNGYRCDEHYWAWLRHCRLTRSA